MDLMNIGAFAVASGLSIHALRHYDEVDVLKPAVVDPDTGYRRYREEQIADAKLICSLRTVDLPVDEIRDVLEAGDRQFTHQVLTRHRKRLSERADAVAKMTADLEEYLGKGIPTPTLNGCRPVQVKLVVRDKAEAIAFFEAAFGVGYTEPGGIQFGTPGYDSFFLITIDEDSGFGLLVDDVDTAHVRALEAGAAELEPPTDYPWMPRRSVLKDPTGNVIYLYQS